MVALGIVCGHHKHIMRRSKTSSQLRTNTTRRSSLQLRSPYFWNTGSGNQDAHRKSVQTTKSDSSSRTNYRRKSIDCTYHLWDLADATEGMKNIKVLEMSDNTREGTRKPNHIFPPISTKSLRNPRLLSAKSSFRSEKTSMKKKLQNGFKCTNSMNDRSPNTSSDFLTSERCNTDSFTHGLPDDGKRYSADATSLQRSQTTFSFGSKGSDDPVLQRSPHSRATKLNASSLHSRSSEGSCNSAAFRAKFARRRQSLPATTSSLIPTKSSEFHKAFKELSRQTDDSNMGMRSSQTTTSLMTLSDKVSTPTSSSTPRDGLATVSIRRDSLQRIEEIPVEQLGTPVFTVNEETKDECHTQDNSGKECHENGPPIHHENITSSAVGTNITGGDGIGRKTGQDLTVAEHSHKQSNDEDAADTDLGNYDCQVENELMQKIDKNVSVLSKKTLNAITEQFPLLKPEIFAKSIQIEDDDSVIDASILNELDEDLCDSDFREKMIIQWIISAETGDRVEQQVESAISPSPTNGSRETAITVIYDG